MFETLDAKITPKRVFKLRGKFSQVDEPVGFAWDAPLVRCLVESSPEPPALVRRDLGHEDGVLRVLLVKSLQEAARIECNSWRKIERLGYIAKKGIESWILLEAGANQDLEVALLRCEPSLLSVGLHS